MWFDLFDKGPKLGAPKPPKQRPAYAKKKTCARCKGRYLPKHFLVAPFDVCQKCKAQEKLGHAA